MDKEEKDIQEFKKIGKLSYRDYDICRAWGESKYFKESGSEWSEPQEKKGFFTIQFHGPLPVKKDKNSPTGYSMRFTGGSCIDIYSSIKKAKEHINFYMEHQNWIPLCPREVRWVKRTNQKVIG